MTILSVKLAFLAQALFSVKLAGVVLIKKMLSSFWLSIEVKTKLFVKRAVTMTRVSRFFSPKKCWTGLTKFSLQLCLHLKWNKVNYIKQYLLRLLRKCDIVL